MTHVIIQLRGVFEKDLESMLNYSPSGSWMISIIDLSYGKGNSVSEVFGCKSKCNQKHYITLLFFQELLSKKLQSVCEPCTSHLTKISELYTTAHNCVAI